ncbi:permease of the major facilitator superfamily [Clostridium sp. SY8519]|uniref:MFS transporter n=1 Tax=Clostridium sp. (strain SY8519) TaxID=1042156 RepID=UPI0002171B6B|nr:MFS transporter [Clostridium sp. SY8519]BAK47583.1 permease of the major facilitator superfamily [Clostridium sp. SY8519]
MAQSKQKVSNNFGVRGWLIIIFFGVMLFLNSSLTADGMNIILPTLAGKIGTDPNAMLSLNGVGGWIAVVGAFVLSGLVQKVGAKKVILVSLAIVAISFLSLTFIKGMAGWAVCIILINVFANGMSFCGGSALIASWFPTKKGMAMGWSTMGNNMASAVFIPIFSIMLGANVNMPFYGYFIFMVIMFILGVIIIKNKPEECGLLPDNDPASVEKVKALEEEMANYKSPWTVGRILKDKDIWCAGLGYGLLFMCTVGLVSQFVARAMGVGFEQNMAVGMLSIAAVIGIVASYLWGVLDTKMGTKLASVVLAIFFAIAILLNILPGHVTFIIYTVMLGCALGGNTNFSTSMCASLFGRKNFQRAFNFVFPVSCIFRAAAAVILGAILGATGGNFTIAYLVFMVGAIVAAVLFGCINMTPKAE